MNRWFRRPNGDHPGSLWPLLLLLMLVVLAPTAVLMWLVSRAAQDERLAVRQRLADTYLASLSQVQREVETQLARRLERCDELARESSLAELLTEVASWDLPDAVVCYDPQGRLFHPTPLRPPGPDLLDDLEAWREATRWEFRENDPRRAAEQYGAIALVSEHPDVQARALQAQARCLGKAGDESAAIAIFVRILESPTAMRARGPHQRLLAADAGLRALELMQANAWPPAELAAVRKRLLELISLGSAEGIPSSQRCFVGRRLEELFPAEVNLPWLAGEELAAEFAASPGPAAAPGVLRPTLAPNVWQIASPQRRVVMLFREATLRKKVEALASRAAPPSPIFVTLLSPNVNDAGEDYLAMTHTSIMPGWRLALATEGESPLAEAAGRQFGLAAWTALLTIAAVGVAAVWLACAIGRQHRLNRLQNDWLATVSHELKTPLASIHLLTDALLDGDRVERNEYLRMISTEATRLTRLIERLLATTRVPGRAAILDRRPAMPADLACAACAAVGEQLARPSCRFQQSIEPDLPAVSVDADALTAALINLLENAWKFTPADKQIALSASREDGWVCFRVSDNGIGISPRDARRVFERFFQVDRRLSRVRGGCGLGLSIVKQTAEAHGGSVDVESTLGRGSTFTLRIPAAAKNPPREEPIQSTKAACR